jgi:hypothetical protein
MIQVTQYCPYIAPKQDVTAKGKQSKVKKAMIANKVIAINSRIDTACDKAIRAERNKDRRAKYR